MRETRILLRDEIMPHDDLISTYASILVNGERIVGLAHGQVVAMTVTHTASYGSEKYGVSATDPDGVEHHLLTDNDEGLVLANRLDLIELTSTYFPPGVPMGPIKDIPEIIE